MPIYALAYERVSTEEQADSNNSIPAQRRRIQDYADRNGITVLEHYTDAGISAFKDDENRTAFWEMICRAKAEKAVSLILVDDALRFYRQKAQAVMVKAELRSYGVQVRSVSTPYDPETIHGFWLEGIDEIRAQAGSMETAFATFRGMEQNMLTRDPETGWCYKNGGRAPYGYEAYHVIKGKNSRGHEIRRTLWRIHPEQAEVVRLILVELRGRRQLSYVAIRDELNRRDIPSPEGDLWATSCIYEFCRRERVLQYAGVYFWNKEDHKHVGRRFKPESEWKSVSNAHPAIISMEEAEAVIALNAHRRKDSTRLHTDTKSTYLLTGKNILGQPFFICTNCGANMIGMNLNPGRSRRKYVCSTVIYKGKDACIYKPILKEPLEEEIIRHIMMIFQDEERLGTYLKKLRQSIADEQKEIVTLHKRLEKQLADTEKQIAAVMNAIAAGVDPALCKEKVAALKVERDELQTRLVNVQAPIRSVDETRFQKFRHTLLEALGSASDADRKEYIKRSVERIEFDPTTEEIRVYPFTAPVEKVDSNKLAAEAVRYAAGARDEAWIVYRTMLDFAREEIG